MKELVKKQIIDIRARKEESNWREGTVRIGRIEELEEADRIVN